MLLLSLATALIEYHRFHILSTTFLIFLFFSYLILLFKYGLQLHIRKAFLSFSYIIYLQNSIAKPQRIFILTIFIFSVNTCKAFFLIFCNSPEISFLSRRKKSDKNNGGKPASKLSTVISDHMTPMKSVSQFFPYKNHLNTPVKTGMSCHYDTAAHGLR